MCIKRTRNDKNEKEYKNNHKGKSKQENKYGDIKRFVQFKDHLHQNFNVIVRFEINDIKFLDLDKENTIFQDKLIVNNKCMYIEDDDEMQTLY